MEKFWRISDFSAKIPRLRALLTRTFLTSEKCYHLFDFFVISVILAVLYMREVAVLWTSRKSHAKLKWRMFGSILFFGLTTCSAPQQKLLVSPLSLCFWVGMPLGSYFRERDRERDSPDLHSPERGKYLETRENLGCGGISLRQDIKRSSELMRLKSLDLQFTKNMKIYHPSSIPFDFCWNWASAFERILKKVDTWQLHLSSNATETVTKGNWGRMGIF